MSETTQLQTPMLMQQPSVAKPQIPAIDFQEDTNQLDRERQAKIAEMEKELACFKNLDRK